MFGSFSTVGSLSKRLAIGSILAAYALIVSPSPAQGQSCDPGFSDAFPAGDFDGSVDEAIQLPPSLGGGLVVAGDFTLAGGVDARGIARWDGSAWHDLAGGLSGGFIRETGMAVYDDGTGEALYVAGFFTQASGIEALGLARWDGTAWSSVGQLTRAAGTAGRGHDCVVWDDGTGPALYVIGLFDQAGGVAARNTARYDGSGWSALGEGLDLFGYALTVHDDGSGPALYAGGFHGTAGGVASPGVARWDGVAWSAVGDGLGLGDGNSRVSDLASVDRGAGPRLVAGGDFQTSGGSPVRALAEWDGLSWTQIGPGTDAWVTALTPFRGGLAAGELYVGASSSLASDPDDVGLFIASDSAMTPVGGNVSSNVFTLEEADLGAGPVLVVGGQFTRAGSLEAARLATWDGSEYGLLGNGDTGNGLSASSTAMVDFDPDGPGPAEQALVTVGIFFNAGDLRVNFVAAWDGQEWSGLGGGLNARAEDAVVYDDGSGPALFVVGAFSEAGGAPARGLAKFDGLAWSEVGGGVGAGARALAVFDDGTGSKLFVGGTNEVGGMPVRQLAAWDGAAWSDPTGGVDGFLDHLDVADLGGGPRLIVLGRGMFIAGGLPIVNIAAWDDSGWDTLAGGPGGFTMNCVEVYDDGSGPKLYASGFFRVSDGAVANFLATWDGAAWAAVPGGDPDAAYADMAIFDDGSGPALFATGGFTSVGGVAVNGLAKYDGGAWSDIGGGLTDFTSGSVLHVHDDDGPGPIEPALYIGGDFLRAGGTSSGRFARWGCVEPACRADIDGDGELTIFDFLAFQNAFDRGDPVADFDGDGDFTIFDFLAFQNEFDAGCP